MLWLWLVSLAKMTMIWLVYSRVRMCILYIICLVNVSCFPVVGSPCWTRRVMEVWPYSPNLGSRFRVIPFGNNFLIFKVVLQISRWMCLFLHHIVKHNNGHSLIASLTGISFHSGRHYLANNISTIFNKIFKEKSCNSIVIKEE